MPRRQLAKLFEYVEHHFRCHKCGLTTVGVVIESIGSTGVGWPSKAEARKAKNLHLKDCDGTPW